MLSAFALLAIAPTVADRALPATPVRVLTEVFRLTGNGPERQRVRAVRWLDWHHADRPVLAALPVLERVARDDTPDVRWRAVIAVGRVAKAHGRPCPSCVLDALFADDENVRAAAGIAVHEFGRLPDRAVEPYLRHTKSDISAQRDTVHWLLAYAAPKHPETVKRLRAATADPDAGVRHNAHCYLFVVTDDIRDMLPHVLRLHAEVSERPELKAGATEAEQFAYGSLSLRTLALAEMTAGWVQSRPVEVRAAFLVVLGHADAKVRAAACRLLAAQAKGAQVEVPGDGGKLDPARVRRGQEALFRNGALKARLAELRPSDPSEAVRTAAGGALDELK